MTEQVHAQTGAEVALPLTEFGERLGTLRLSSPQLEHQLQESLARYGQTAPVVAWRAPDGSVEMLDGFKRLRAARELKSETLRVRVLEVTSRVAKALMVNLNANARSMTDLEEGWVVRALVREDGLEQQEVARLLGRHKSWVCRRLSLVEKLSEEVQEQLKLGLVSTTVARELARLQRGNQEKMLKSIDKFELGSRDVAKLVDRFESSSPAQQRHLLSHPLEALEKGKKGSELRTDARLSGAGNRLKEQLVRMETACQVAMTGMSAHPFAQMTPIERKLLNERMNFALVAARQAGRALESALREQEEAHERDDDRSGAPSGARAEKARRLVQPEAGESLPYQPQHGAQAAQAGSSTA